MTVKNLGDANLGPTSIPESDRKAWPAAVSAPQGIEFTSAATVTNEVYYRRSTAYQRAGELLGTSIFYMVYHIGVEPDSVYLSTFGAGIVVTDDEAGASDEGAGLYHDACSGRLVAEHVRDGRATLKIQGKGKTTEMDTVRHFHVAGYGAPDDYSNLDLSKLYQEIYEERGTLAQREMISAFGTGIRQYLPTYWHSARDVGDLKGIDPRKVPFERFIGLRVPAGLKARRGYVLKPELPKHHIYYLNFPGSPFFLDEPGWR
ncbi:MAG: hypothetical protein R3E12_05480 [Candidatus Eisenbacteria bacterium]|uniref:Uncharacterized protein n=1 Tax=Eiseniibacteriota bacterium TaxID=2212470 RepID=A0A956M065_UNCEI|nr:hypothetical protein [Candidatus Eisenbacteria bacterium]